MAEIGVLRVEEVDFPGLFAMVTERMAESTCEGRLDAVELEVAADAMVDVSRAVLIQ